MGEVVFGGPAVGAEGRGRDRSASESSQLGTKSSKSFLKTQIELNDKSFVIYLSFAAAARAAVAVEALAAAAAGAASTALTAAA